MNSKHQAFEALERIKSRKLEKTEHDRALLQEAFLVYA
jgi:hypothetical protein